jgi:predicted ATP-grasp superfamily ATP-dependent carboligase
MEKDKFHDEDILSKAENIKTEMEKLYLRMQEMMREIEHEGEEPIGIGA